MATVAREKNEQVRMQERRRVRTQIARAKIQLERSRSLLEQENARDREIDQAVREHETTCSTIQAALARVEKKVERCLVNREPVPESLERERREALEQLHAANENLECETARLRRTRKPARGEQRLLGEASGQLQVLQNSLAQKPLANPRLLLDLHCAKQAVKFAELRLRAADEQVGTWTRQIEREREGDRQRTELNEYGHSRRLEPTHSEFVYAERLERWEAESAAAASALAKSQAEITDIHQRLIDE